jgi:chitinase
MSMLKTAFYTLLCSLLSFAAFAQTTGNKKCNVLAYYTGDSATIDTYNVAGLTHIIFSFTHLQGNSLHVDKAQDTITIRKLVALKKKYPALKIIFSMGGWGGCEHCSAVFNTDAGRKEFAASSKHLLQYFNADGLDLDWEYPTIEGYPNHQFLPEDRHNFTMLIQQLRKAFGSKYEISFAAGGFTDYILHSVEWDQIMPLLDRVNLMTYDLVNGNSTFSGHSTPLYSTPDQRESGDNAVRMLDSMHVPLKKLVLGAAFYARIFQVQDSLNNGLYRTCKFLRGVDYKHMDAQIVSDTNYHFHWDSIAHAPYYFNEKENLLVTFDDKQSVAEKTQYVIDHRMDGIMFWELTGDIPNNGLLQAIDSVAEKH